MIYIDTRFEGFIGLPVGFYRLDFPETFQMTEVFRLKATAEKTKRKQVKSQFFHK